MKARPSPRPSARTRTAAAAAALLTAAGLLAAAQAPAAADPLRKITPEVKADLADDGRADLVVTLRDTPDLAGTGTGDTPAADVYDELTGHAATAQENLLDLLDARGADYESFWITNTVKVTGADAALAADVAALGEVAELREEGVIVLDEPGEPAAPSTDDVQWGVAAIGADDVWSEYGVTGQGVVVANIDSGVQYDHPALVGSYRGNNGDGTFTHAYNWFDPTGICGAAPCDNHGHGTHTMGTMVAADGYGVAPGATWIAAKGCEGRSCSETALTLSGQWLLAPTDPDGRNPRPDLAPDVINNSWGGGQGDTWYAQIIDAWHAAGIFTPFAAGNEAYGRCATVSSPGDNPGTYTVGAVDADGVVAPFSGRGPTDLADGKPDITAPGVDVTSTVPGGGYESLDGTSMATPHVAGAVALLWSAAPALHGDLDATARLLGQGAHDVADLTCGGTAERNYVYGEGILDVHASVGLAPIGETTELTGTVTAADGTPIPLATVAVTGANERRTATGHDGRYRLRLPAGDYTVTASAYGYDSASTDVVLAGEPVAADLVLADADRHDLGGVVTDPYGRPVAGAEIALDGTPLDPVTTDGDGRYAFTDVAAGTYPLTATPAEPARCLGPAEVRATVDGGDADVALTWKTDGLGWYCADVDHDWRHGRDDVAIAGDEDAATVDLPFPVSFYGIEYDAVNVTTDGLLVFGNPRVGDYANVAPGSTFVPNGYIAAFWDDMTVDHRTKIRTGVDGRDGHRTFVVEIRDLAFADGHGRVGTEVVFDETGGFTVAYRGIRGDRDAGSSATIGIESPSGSTGTTYSVDAATLTSGLAIRYRPGDSATADTLTGTTDYASDSAETIGASLADRLAPGVEETDVLDPAETPEGAEPGASGTAATPGLAADGVIESDNGPAELVAVDGTDDLFQINRFGTLARVTEDGEYVWRRAPDVFYAEWGVTPLRPWDTADRAFRISVGLSGVGLGTGTADRSYAVGDLTGDGVPDLAFAALVGENPSIAVRIPGETLTAGTFVTVLDGATGATTWHTFLPYAYDLTIIGDTLIAADNPGYNRYAYTQTAGLHAYAFDDGVGTPLWTIDTGSHYVSIDAVLDAGNGTVAYSAKDHETAAGTLSLVDLATGAVRWTVIPEQPVRGLAHDEGRDLIVGTEQSPFGEDMYYTVATYGIADGARTAVTTRYNALPIALEAADVDKPAGAEYLVAEALADQYGFVHASQLRGVDGTGRQLWPSYAVKRSPDVGEDGSLMTGIVTAGDIVLVNRADDGRRGRNGYRETDMWAALTAIDGRHGDVEWEVEGTVASTTNAVVDGRSVLTEAADHTVHVYDLRHGRERDAYAAIGPMTHLGAYDVNGDGVRDVLAGGEGHGVFAFDGTDLDTVPTVLWRADTPGSIRDMQIEDVTGGDTPEVVVAASEGVVVLDVRTGGRVASVDGHGEYVWSVTVADLTGDGRAELIVPTDEMRVYTGAGRPLWSYGPAEGVVFGEVSVGPDGVFASYTPKAGADSTATPTQVALSRGGRTLWTVEQDPGDIASAELLGGTLADAAIPYADGHAVASAWGSTRDENGWTSIVVQIRDARTGEQLTEYRDGAAGLHRGFIATSAGLVQTHMYGVTLFDGTGVADPFMSFDVWGAAPAVTVDGTPVLATTSYYELQLFPLSVIATGDDYPRPVAESPVHIKTGAVLVADLDGDGVDEFVTAAMDEVGHDLMLGLTGFGQWTVTDDRAGIGVYRQT